MKKIDANISGAVKVKQLVSQVSKIGSVLNLMTSPQGQTTWNTDCTDDADATDTINRKEIFGSEHQNPRVCRVELIAHLLLR